MIEENKTAFHSPGFNAHGQMLYEWINDSKTKVTGSPSNAEADGNNIGTASASDMVYYNAVEEGWRADGWYEIDGSEDLEADSDTDWYYFDDGEAEKTESSDAFNLPTGKTEYRMKKKISENGSKYFCFNEKGQMQTGLQYVNDGFYFFDDNGYMQTGKVSNVEEDNDSFTYYFNTSNGHNGQGVTGEKSGYLYFNGKRLEADDDYRLYFVKDKVYLVNTSGKIQSSKTKKFYIEELDKEYKATFGSGDNVLTLTELNDDGDETTNVINFETLATENAMRDGVTLPVIELYDSEYSYEFKDGEWIAGFTVAQ